MFKAWELLGYNLNSNNPDIKIIYTYNTKTWKLGDKKELENNINIYSGTGITFISDFGEYDSNSNTPNFLLKPKNGVAGNGIEMYKQPNKLEKENYVRQKYIKAKQQNYLLEYDGKELIKFDLGSNRLYDIRSIIYISEDGDIIFTGAYKRVSGFPLPKKLPNGNSGISKAIFGISRTSSSCIVRFLFRFADILCKFLLSLFIVRWCLLCGRIIPRWHF